MPRSLPFALIAGLLALSAHATPPQNADFSGAWRLDDRNSDSSASVTTAMRDEARKEQQANTQNPQDSASQAGSSGNQGNGGGHRGGMGGGGGSGGGMGGHGGGMGGGGMGGGSGGGGHGRHGGNGNTASTSNDKGSDAGNYPLPPTLDADSVLLVQQDAKTVEVHLGNGDRLTATLDGQTHQSLNGNAMVRGHIEAGRMDVAIQYADGTQLVQSWTLSPDGKQMVVTGNWKIPTLQQPVSFKRTYVGLH